ncbi:MAG: hypothetical protein A2233_01090 [Candidatus Kerfeldbacteria bacterium RIFOXYA2_FULL_38_24]|uniref:BioF2-like acetyltransferase domain-containing protein n=1 Tax=Candidatus Kerfeldbacteria bacterium RIFOXYB2_FULL_38_14 TaxID=1798547 RepID=A0A1G2BBM0_9BACT|nr:MAG: hypothetical protein A2233_01090 [Candidatus Kerfeldbacteria bacterium RIFOXYA2_FULL_38_24]OGY86532.1 MAG: hypothetical protein A2319_02080 [Candidatus Kerfeldbacteria bacterium RIFOXYB2_FULL_38_14]OGY89265.1 MAG: hypothetical protein A2458_00795 [Candidatus Kerfeldbacteria bacterium RIFOXYC2_FULL_38_9]
MSFILATAENLAQGDDFLIEKSRDAQATSVFLQSSSWLTVQENYGRKVYSWFYQDQKGGEIKGVVAGIVMPLPFGKSYFFSPRGPILEKKLLAEFLQTSSWLETIKKENIIFWRFEPLADFKAFNLSACRQVADHEPSQTAVLDLSLNADLLFASLKQKTRYNINLAKRHEIKIDFVSQGDLTQLKKIFWQLTTATGARHHLKHFPKNYYDNLIDILAKKGMLEVAIAKHQQDILAINLNILFGHSVIYLLGASAEQKKNLMAPYLLQWQAISRAQKAGFRWYDFYGIATGAQHKLAGVTKFKQGFAGQTVNYPGTFEKTISPFWYFIYKTGKQIRF